MAKIFRAQAYCIYLLVNQKWILPFNQWFKQRIKVVTCNLLNTRDKKCSLVTCVRNYEYYEYWTPFSSALLPPATLVWNHEWVIDCAYITGIPLSSNVHLISAAIQFEIHWSAHWCIYASKIGELHFACSEIVENLVKSSGELVVHNCWLSKCYYRDKRFKNLHMKTTGKRNSPLNNLLEAQINRKQYARILLCDDWVAEV